MTDAPFYAKGDAFTNDNAAIQAAINHVSAKDGGSRIRQNGHHRSAIKD